MIEKVGVVIVDYNCSSDILRCLKKLPHRDIMAIVVVDNGSIPATPTDIFCEFPSVFLVRSEKNLGFGGGCNLGVAELLRKRDVDYLFFLNPDTICDSLDLPRLLSEFASSDVGLVAPRIMSGIAGDELWYGGGRLNWWKGSVSVDGYGKPPEPAAFDTRAVTFASGCAIVVRRDVFEAVSGFDETFFMYEEDVDLSLNISNIGFLLVYVGATQIFHIGQGSQGEGVKGVGMFSGDNPKLPFFVYYTVRNRLLLLQKHAGLKAWSMFAMAF